jgi:hypothetical protein
MTSQKNLRNVNFKGLKLALKNLGRFSSPTASRAVLRGEYQHSDIHLQWTQKVLTGLYMLITFFMFKIQLTNVFCKQSMHQ